MALSDSTASGPQPQPRTRDGRLLKVLRYATALDAHLHGLGDDWREREWALLDPRDQIRILRWMKQVEAHGPKVER